MAYIFTDFNQKIVKALEHIQSDLATLRTGKASPQLLDPVNVEAYGTRMKVHELANVSAPDPNLLMVTPWDKGILGNIEKAIASAGLNLNPVVDGMIIRIVVPALTEERRKDMVKALYQKAEYGKKMLRTIRQDAKKEIEAMADEGGVSEDDVKVDLDQLEKLIKRSEEQIDEMAKKKEADLMEI